MRESLFAKYLEKDLGRMVQKILNEIKEEETYLFKELFKERYHWDFTFESLLSKRLILASDEVGLEGLLTKRISQGPSQEYIPKTQARITLKESELKELFQIESLDMSEGIFDRIYCDIKESVKNFYDQIEHMCLEGLSRGMYELKDHKDPQKGHRVILNIPSENVFRVSQSWADPAAKALHDIERIVEAALKKGHRIERIWMPFEIFKLLRDSHQLKERYPGEHSLKRLNESLSQDYGSQIEIKVIRRPVKIRKAQGEVLVNPWAEGKVIFLSQRHAGDLLHAELSMDRYYNALMKTQRPESYLSISKFSKVDPYCECTLVEGRVLPVLRDPESIYYENVAREYGVKYL